MYLQNLKKIRQKLGLSMAKFAQKLEIPAPTLTCYERGERTPSANLFLQLHDKINVNLNWFISGKGDMFLDQDNYQTIKDKIMVDVRQLLKDEGLIN